MRYLFLILITAMSMLQSCVDEGVLEFPDEDGEPAVITESISLVTYLNYLSEDNNRIEDACFKLVYPFELGFSNGISISVSSEDGLIEAVNGQTSGFYISGAEFPIVVDQDNTLSFIESENEFVRLLWECDITTFREELEYSYAQCYEFDYPFNTIIENGSEIEVPSLEFLGALNETTSELYQPKFVYPITVNLLDEGTSIDVNNEYDLYQIINDCESCPVLEFDIEEDHTYTYIFEANKELLRATDSYAWFIDDLQKEIDGPAVNGDNKLIKRLQPGTYEICMKSQGTDCNLGVEYCETLVVEDEGCPFLFYEVTRLENRAFLFEAEFPRMNEIDYWWVVYKKGIDQAIAYQPDSGQNLYEYFFEEPGTYSVCLEYEGEDCDFVCYCQEFFIE
ncbi:MAG: iron-sulfur cluster assembly scaffold protein [bacterium]|nr:iron-sulfur cluster assembly scaffold protein [bacterium]